MGFSSTTAGGQYACVCRYVCIVCITKLCMYILYVCIYINVNVCMYVVFCQVWRKCLYMFLNTLNVCMYVCMYVWICMYVCVHLHACMYVCMYVCIMNVTFLIFRRTSSTVSSMKMAESGSLLDIFA